MQENPTHQHNTIQLEKSNKQRIFQVVKMPSKLRKAIGAVKDQTSISLAKVSNTSAANLEVAILKATTHDHVPIDERYVNEILQLISSNKVYAAACAQAIGKRIGKTRNWIVALKSLMLVLRVFQDGDPYFPREILHAMKRGAKILNLSSFRDDSNSSPWDYTAFVRTFALYLDERLDCFLTGKLQRRFTNRDKQSFGNRDRRNYEPVGDMKPAMLLDKLSYWQRLLDRAIATRPTGAARTNRLVQICLYAVVQESFDLYRDLSDGLALILDSFFHLQYQSCMFAFQICVKASKQFQELCSFYDLCKSIGVGRTSEYPSVQKVSDELVETLQEFLKDQASFPSNGRSPPQHLMLPAPPVSKDPGSSSDRLDSYDYSSEPTERSSDRTSNLGSRRTSLEDLMSSDAGTSPGFSVDRFSEQLERQSLQEDTVSAPETCTNLSLSDNNGSSTTDLVLFDDWPQEDQKQEPEKEQPNSAPDSNATDCWELVLFETAKQPATAPAKSQASPSAADGFPPSITDNFFDQPSTSHSPSAANGFAPSKIMDNLFDQPSTSHSPNAANGFAPSTIMDNFFDQPSTSHQHGYNPFLDDTTDLFALAIATPSNNHQAAAFSDNDLFSVAPTFQATQPTFCAHSPNRMQFQNENDPFGPFDAFTNNVSTGYQQNVLHEQQLWLENQNRIIAKHLS